MNKIKKIIMEGNTLYPIFVEADDKDFFILEGRHKIVSFYECGLLKVPVIFVKKSNIKKTL